MHNVEHGPGHAVGGEQMTEEAPNIAQLVGLVAMDRIVIFSERLLILFRPNTIQLAETFADKTIKV